VHIPAQTIATDTTTNPSAGVDMNDKVAVLFEFFTGARTDGTYTPNIQESDDDSTYTEVDSERIIGAETALSAANGMTSIGVHPTKRYVRCQAVSASTTSGAIVGVNVTTFSS
jgi:hypothetical protein